MKTYFERGGIKIYHGDCREVLPTLDGVDLICSDPPYGINYVHGEIKIKNATKFAGVKVVGDDKPFDAGWLLSYPNVLLWGVNHYHRTIDRKGRWLVWDKRCQVVPQRDQADCELAWCSEAGVDRVFYHVWDGFLKDSERGEPRVHPTQKPVALMKWCLSFFRPSLICDPYMGSGTTLLAARDMGVPCAGIEMEEQYCEIAARRLEQEVFDFSEGEK